MPGTNSSLVQRISRFFWLDVPVAARGRSAAMGGVLADGVYLVAWPWVAVLGAPLSFLAGLVCGLHHPGEVFSNSILMVAGMFLVANFSSALGLYLWCGYFVGDFFHFHIVDILHDELYLRRLLCFWIALLLANFVLGCLLVIVPTSAKALRIQTRAELKLSLAHSRLKDVILQASIQAILVLAWTQAAPPMIRPIWAWQRIVIPVDHIRPLQHDGWIAALSAGVLGAIRIILECRATAKPWVLAHIRELQAALARIKSRGLLRLPSWASLVLRAAFATFITSGFATNWWEPLEILLMFVLIFFLRGFLASHWTFWRSLTSRVPLLARLVAASVLGALLGWPILARMWDIRGSFQALILTGALSLLIITFMAPGYGVPATAQKGSRA